MIKWSLTKKFNKIEAFISQKLENCQIQTVPWTLKNEIHGVKLEKLPFVTLIRLHFHSVSLEL